MYRSFVGHIILAFVLLLSALLSSETYAQAPQGINYQAVARTPDGSPLADTTLDLTITIAQDAGLNTEDYVEVHTVSTNTYGLFSLIIGQGAPTAGSFGTIDWSIGEKFVNVQIGSLDMGTTQLMSVPYALFAGNVGGGAVDDGDWDTSNVAVFTNKAVGIGTGFPAGDLNVVNDNGLATINLQGAGDNFTYSAFELGNRENNRQYRILQAKANDSRNYFIIDYWDGTQVTPRLTIDTLGRVGIAESNPDATLDVSGSIEVDTLRIGEVYSFPSLDGTAGQMLVTDGAGNITWQNSTDSLQGFQVVNDTTLRIIEGNGDVFDVSLDHFATDIELSDVQIALLNEMDQDSTYLNDSIDQVAADLANEITFLLSELQDDSTYLNDSIDQVAADLANFIANSTDTNITEGLIVGTELALINNAGDTVFVDISSLATDGEVADIETAIYNEIDADSTYLNDSIDQVAADLANEITFLLSELQDDSTYLNDSIDQVAADLANFIANSTDTNITEGLIVGTELALINSVGDTVLVDIASLATDNELANIETAIYNEIDADSTYLNDSIDQVALGLLNHIADDLDTDTTNELITQLFESGDSIYIVEGGDTFELDLSGLSSDTLDRIVLNDSNLMIMQTGQVYINFDNNDDLNITPGALRNQNLNDIFIGNFLTGESDDETYVENIGIGAQALQDAVNVPHNTAIGARSFQGISSGGFNTGVGRWSGVDFISGSDNVMLGNFAGGAISGGDQNVFVGSDINGTIFGTVNEINGAIRIGYQAGNQDSTDNKLFIDNSSTNSPLIWGDFANNILQVGGSFRVNNLSGDTLSYPTVDGDSGWLMQTDGAGQLNFVDPLTLFSTDTLDIIADDDADTRIEIDNIDHIRFDVAGVERLTIDSFGGVFSDIALDGNFEIRNRTDVLSTGQTREVMRITQRVADYVNESGGHVSLVGNDNNNGAPEFARISWTTLDGSEDTGHLGFWTVNGGVAGRAMTIDQFQNVGIGTYSPSSRLDVEGKGQFDTLEVEGAYTLPIADGDSGWVMQTDGLGQVSFVDPSTLNTGVQNGLDSVLSFGSNANNDSILNLGYLTLGTTTPAARIDVVDNTENFSINVTNSTNSALDKKGVFSVVSGGGIGDNYGVYGESNGAGMDKFGVYGGAQGAGGVKYGIYGNASGAGTNYAGYFNAGNVYIDGNLGIGDLGPVRRLDITGDVGADSVFTTELSINNFLFPDPGTALSGQYLSFDGVNMVWDSTASDDDFFRDGNYLYTTNPGDSVLLGDPGENTPLFVLDVYGQAFIDTVQGLSSVYDTYTGDYLLADSVSTDTLEIGSLTGAFPFKLTGDSPASNGDVLSYQDGVAVWSSLASGADNDWDTTLTGDTVFTQTKYVGIGTSNPNARFAVLSSDSINASFISGGSNAGTTAPGVVIANTKTGLGNNLGAVVSATGASGDNFGIATNANGGTDARGLVGDAINGSVLSVGIQGFAALSPKSIGVRGFADALSLTDTAIAIYGEANGLGNKRFAGYFGDGDVFVKDTLEVDSVLKYSHSTVQQGFYLRTNADGTVYADTFSASTCPAGFSQVNESFCIETAARTTETEWFEAADTCSSLGASLPSWMEWYIGTKEVLGVDYNTTQAWEWIDQASQNNASIVGGGIGATLEDRRKTIAADNPISPSNTVQYRCVYRLK